MMDKLTGGTLIPAFGRNYKNRTAVITDLNKGLDFTVQTYNFSGYCSIRDLANGSFQVRNASLEKLWLIKVKDGVAG